MQSSSSLSSEEQAKVLNPHEYIRNTVNLRYQDCISCGNRTEFTCIKCGYCYSCHWKKEQVEEIELRNNLKDFYLSLPKASIDTKEDDDNDHAKSEERPNSEEQAEHEKWGTIDVLGNPAEPICTYYRCHHRFSLHGSTRCRCKHPNNKALGLFVRYL
jgi:hypothetical protein